MVYHGRIPNKPVLPEMKVFDTDRYVYQYVIDPIAIHLKTVNPNWITVLSMPLSFGIFLANYLHPFGWIFAIVTNIARTLCDFLDGHIARKYNRCTKLGGLLDSIADLVHSVNYIMFFIVIFWPTIGLYYFVIDWIGVFVCVFFWLWKKGVVLDHDQMDKLGNSPVDVFIALGKYDGLLLNLFMLFGLLYLNHAYGSK